MITRDKFHEHVARKSFPELRDELDALALMILLHTHEIVLKTPLDNAGTLIRTFSPITQRHAAEVVAAVWKDRSDAVRDWYWEFNTRTPFEVIEDVPAEWAGRIEAARRALESHPLIHQVNPEP